MRGAHVRPRPPPLGAHRHQHGADDLRAGRHPRPRRVHGDRRRGESRRAPRGAEQGLRHAHHRLRAHARRGEAATRLRSSRSAT
ncbi:MAG: hypothetical protein MZW92_32360 [Comamonadaceae bacterium]|nr:hypothetical protein [Comamonadaceae bacterium]